MLNNYLHDLATGLLFVSAVVMLAINKKAVTAKADSSFVVDIYRYVSALAMASFIWIIVGGIPRLVFFKRIEWPNAVGKGLVVALGVKHVLLFMAVAAGGALWLSLRKTIRALKVSDE